MIWSSLISINRKKGEQVRITSKTKDKGSLSQSRIFLRNNFKWGNVLKFGLRNRDYQIIKENKLIGITERGKIINQLRLRSSKSFIGKKGKGFNHNSFKFIKNIERRERFKIKELIRRSKNVERKHNKEVDINCRFNQLSSKTKLRKIISECLKISSIKIKGRLRGLKKRKIKIIINSFKSNRINKLESVLMKKDHLRILKIIDISYNKTGIITVQRQ